MKNKKLTQIQISVLEQAAKTGTFNSSELSLKSGARKKVLDNLICPGLLIILKEPNTYDISPQGKKVISIKDEHVSKEKGKIHTGTKLHTVIELLPRQEGAPIAEIMEHTG